MKFTSYQNRMQVGNTANTVSNITYNDGSSVVANQQAGLFNAIGKSLTTFADTVSNAKAMEANNYYNQRMSEETNALMQSHREGEAAKLGTLYEEKQKSVMDEVKKKYGSYIRFGRGAAVFGEYTMRDNANRKSNLMRYQAGELEKFADTQYNNSIDTCHANAMDGGYTNEALDGAMGRIKATVETRYAAYGDERVKAELAKQNGRLIGSALEIAVKNSEGGRIIELCNTYGSKVDAGVANKMKVLSEVLLKEKKQREDFVRFKGILKPGTTIEQVAQARANERAGHELKADAAGAAPIEKHELGIASGAEQIEALTPELKAALPVIGGLLKQQGMQNAKLAGVEAKPAAAEDADTEQKADNNSVEINLPEGTDGEKAESVRRFFAENGSFGSAEFVKTDDGSFRIKLSGYKGGLEQKAAAEGAKDKPAVANAEITMDDRKWAEDYFKWSRTEDTLEKMAIGQVLDAAALKLDQLMLEKEGMVSEDEVNAIINPQLTGDLRRDVELKKLGKSYVAQGLRAMGISVGRAGGGGGGGGRSGGGRSGGSTGARTGSAGGIRPDFEYIMYKTLSGYSTYGEARLAIYEAYSNNELNDKEFGKALKMAEEKNKHTGMFAIEDMDAIKQSVRQALPGFDPADIAKGLRYAVRENDEYIKEHGESMPMQTIIDTAIGSITDNAGTITMANPDYDKDSFLSRLLDNPQVEESFSTAQLASYGIRALTENEDDEGFYIVRTMDGGSYRTAKERVAAVLEGSMTLEEALLGG